MTSPADVAAFHAEYDRHTDDRIRLFRAVAAHIPRTEPVLYPGSYVDIAPSVWFDEVTYVDLDKRANRFFAQEAKVGALINAKRAAADADVEAAPRVAFEHADYREPLSVADGSVGLLVSLYAGFISEHCSRYLRSGGRLLVNDSHGDASMASLDPAYRLSAVVLSRSGDYRVSSDDLDRHLQPKAAAPTVAGLHERQRGVAYTTSPFAYVFTRA